MDRLAIAEVFGGWYLRKEYELLLIGRHLRRISNNSEMDLAEYVAYLGSAGKNKFLAIISPSKVLHPTETCLQSPSCGFEIANLKIFELGHSIHTPSSQTYLFYLFIQSNCMSFRIS